MTFFSVVFCSCFGLFCPKDKKDLSLLLFLHLLFRLRKLAFLMILKFSEDGLILSPLGFSPLMSFSSAELTLIAMGFFSSYPQCRQGHDFSDIPTATNNLILGIL